MSFYLMLHHSTPSSCTTLLGLSVSEQPLSGLQDAAPTESVKMTPHSYTCCGTNLHDAVISPSKLAFWLRIKSSQAHLLPPFLLRKSLIANPSIFMIILCSFLSVKIFPHPGVYLLRYLWEKANLLSLPFAS